MSILNQLKLDNYVLHKRPEEYNTFHEILGEHCQEVHSPLLFIPECLHTW